MAPTNLLDDDQEEFEVRHSLGLGYSSKEQGLTASASSERKTASRPDTASPDKDDAAKQGSKNEASEEEADPLDDYMSMMVSEPTTSTKETSLQRAQRKKREGEKKAYTKSKAEREADAIHAREKALAKSMDASNKGFKMMAKLGYKAGTALGKSADARLEPINIVTKEDRGGIGLDNEKKRKIREHLEAERKRVKVQEETAEEYRARMIREREEKRVEGQVHGAQKVCQNLDTEGEEAEEAGRRSPKNGRRIEKPLKSVNILWRGLARHQREKEQERRARHELQTGIAAVKLPTYAQDDDDRELDRLVGKTYDDLVYDEDLLEEDQELEEFNALPSAERLEKVVAYLRERHQYCFWCRTRYLDKEMEGCPGSTEAEHEEAGII